MSNLKTLTVNVASAAIGTPIEFNQTPLLSAREAKVHLSKTLTTGVIELQGSDLPDQPGENDPTWEKLAELKATSGQLAEVRTARWVRAEVTTAAGGDGNVVLTFEGVQ